VLKILQLLKDCEIGVRHDAFKGFSAVAKGPLGVLGLVVIFGLGAVVVMLAGR